MFQNTQKTATPAGGLFSGNPVSSTLPSTVPKLTSSVTFTTSSNPTTSLFGGTTPAAGQTSGGLFQPAISQPSVFKGAPATSGATGLFGQQSSFPTQGGSSISPQNPTSLFGNPQPSGGNFLNPQQKQQTGTSSWLSPAIVQTSNPQPINPMGLNMTGLFPSQQPNQSSPFSLISPYAPSP